MLMDRQAWIAISLCVLGLIGWYAYTATHLPPPKPIFAGPSPSAEASSSPAAATSPGASASPVFPATPSPSPAETTPTFTEKSETMTNGDVELHLTNRGGAITEAVLLNHTGENGNRVALNALDRTPIGAIVEQPDATALSEFSIAKQADGSVEFER